MKYLKQIVNKCEKLPNMEFKSVLEELENFSDILDQILKEVWLINFFFEKKFLFLIFTNENLAPEQHTRCYYMDAVW